MSDPSTKDLISEARRKARLLQRGRGCAKTGPRLDCYHCLYNALADRLEEVEEGVPRCHDCGALDWVATRGATIAHCASCGHSVLIRPDEHGPKPKVEPSDPEPDDSTHIGVGGLAVDAGLYEDPEPDNRCTFTREHCGVEHRCVGFIGHPGDHLVNAPWGPVTYPKSEPEKEIDALEMIEQVAREQGDDWIRERDRETLDPEPEDDPWEAVESAAGRHMYGDLSRALLDLRKRVEETRRWHLALVALVSRIEGRTATLEGHADRGNEAEKGLRDWIHRLIQEDNHARKVRGTLRDDLEKIDDFTEALAGRVERLDEERKVSLEARRHLLDEVQKLWRMEGRVERLEAHRG